ncbi:hypothetical protein [Roseomonas indoligenes]|uniref:Uncharacterized protein n=1 Tax=Roseomonas indoligenes TaxID=2820811 RepID=A0A940S568_9PROT|nr:hypothetical protein [Pararoseomonas indoligenes]MBP0492704.1 hypothetical protein [Pararoseomonas indoligenes]
MMLWRWALLSGAYLLMAGSVQGAEVAAAVIGGGAAAAFSMALRRCAPDPFSFGAVRWRAFASLPGTLVRETATVAAVLLRALFRAEGERGSVAEQPFEHGPDSPEEAARRAFSVLGLSLAPNSYVLDEPVPGALALHRLSPQPPVPDRRWPL